MKELTPVNPHDNSGIYKIVYPDMIVQIIDESGRKIQDRYKRTHSLV